MRIISSDFIVSVANSKMIKNDYEEIAFVGRSNVGKSSLINFLCNRKTLAKTSSTPGRTRLINYFLINKSFYFVDLPGYGFAKGFKEEQIGWKFLIEGYLERSKNIKLICVLLDIRRKPSEDDIQMINYLQHYNIPFIIIATKCDKFSKAQLGIAIQNLAQALKVGRMDIFPVSALSKIGREEVLQKFDQFIGVE